MMSEIYTLRAPENFNYNNDYRSSPVNIKNYRNSYDQKPKMDYLTLNYRKQTSSDDLLKASPSPIYKNSNLFRTRPEFYHLKGRGNDPDNSNNGLSPVLANEKRKSSISYQLFHEQKPEMYYLNTGDEKTSDDNRQSPSTNDIREKPKLNGILIHSNSPYSKKVTTYMITASNEDHFLPDISRTSSSPIRPNKKNQLVSFNTVNHNDKYAILNNKQTYFPTPIRYVPLSQSKATESIQRSINKYRFRKN